jgi:signal transduction histidine kinase
MTTSATVPDRRRWWQYAGPWPLYPVADALVAALVALSARSFIMSTQSVPVEIFSAAIFGLILFILLELARRYLARVVATFLGYVTTIALAVALATLVRFAQGFVNDYAELSTPGDVVFAIFRSTVALLVIQAIIGTLQERLQRQVDATQEALDVVEAQAEALLTADEEVRRSVATLLHDRVQGGLLAACLRLQVVAQDRPDSRQEIDRVIRELEELRALDVRRAVRTLSPNLRDIDLETAVRELVEPYAPPLEATVDIPREAVSDATMRLAAYRIIEQGLLNAIDHGRASRISIAIEPESTGIRISIADDGRGLTHDGKPGFGTTLVDTWCRALGGSWQLLPGVGAGATLTVRLPSRSPSVTLP